MSEKQAQAPSISPSELAGRWNTGEEQARSQAQTEILERGSQATLTEQGNNTVHCGRQKDFLNRDELNKERKKPHKHNIQQTWAIWV